MKLKFTSDKGSSVVSIGMEKSPATANGASPTGAPGVAALEILSGLGHGATAGLGGADWQVGCGTFRGENYILGPSYNQEKSDEAGCAAAGIGRLCSPSNPKGVWLFPVQLRLLPSTAGRWSMTLPVAGRLFALELCASVVQPEPPLPPLEVPCSCDECGGLCSALTVTEFRSRQIETTYPGLGRDTGFTPTGGPILPYSANTQPVPSCYYSRRRLLDGQNFLPPWVPNVELENGNDELSWLLSNTDPLITMQIDMVLHVRYGKFDLAKAIEEFCERCVA